MLKFKAMVIIAQNGRVDFTMNILLMDVCEVSQYLGVSTRTVYNLMHSKNFPSMKIGRKWVTTREKLDKWIVEEMEKNKE